MPKPSGFLGYNALLGDGSYVENRPSKMQRLMGILNEYNPVDAFWRLAQSDMAKGGPISHENIADGLTVAGTVTGGSSFAPKPRNALNMGIRAYHGSPHDFDRFSMDKIGTGEGAQAYGHGLYFAENEGVARGYRKALEKGNPTVNIGDQHIIDVHDALMNAGEMDKARALEFLHDGGDALYVKSKSEYLSPETLNWFNKEIAPQIKRDGGRMYEVNINADPNAFLDWDKPLSEQPQVQARLATIDEAARSQTTKGMDKYISLENQLPDRAAVTAKLREAGIPGIKYLDAGSRPNIGRVDMLRQQLNTLKDRSASQAAIDYTQKQLDEAEKGISRNYVVFDDKLISIVRKYGIAGASAMLGYDILQNASPAQAEQLRKLEPAK